jgi:DNA processing protein
MTSAPAGQQAQLYWLALHLVPGLGTRNALKLIRHFGDPQRIFHASLSELKACAELPLAVAESIHSGITFEDASAEADKAKTIQAEIIPFPDPRYPQRLKEIFDPPILLYARGRVEWLGSHQIAVVGTRRPTPYGRAVAQKLSRELARAGLTIVSGMARGIDTCAHQGALESGGATIAVLGNGVDVAYPRENRKLMDQIAERGLLLSEFSLSSTAFPQNFPIRNRIISGLAYAVLVVEGAQYSGSLITARLALEQGREVLAVPGNITSKPSWGPNLLIKDGAKLIQEASDVVEELPLVVRQELARAAETSPAAAANVETFPNQQASLWQEPSLSSPLGKKLLALLQVDISQHIDEIIRHCEPAPPADVLSALSELELFGVIKQLPGKHFVRVWMS